MTRSSRRSQPRIADARLWFGKGAKESSAILGRIGETKGILAIYTAGTVELRFAYMKGMPPFDEPDHLKSFVDELAAIPGVSFPPGRFEWPNCPLLGLADDASFERFVSAFERALDEMRQ